MSLSYHKLVRGGYLLVFLAGSAHSLIDPKPERVAIACLALIGLIAYDIVCSWKERTKSKDYGPELLALAEKAEVTAQHVKEMKDDVGIGKLANNFRRG